MSDDTVENYFKEYINNIVQITIQKNFNEIFENCGSIQVTKERLFAAIKFKLTNELLGDTNNLFTRIYESSAVDGCSIDMYKVVKAIIYQCINNYLNNCDDIINEAIEFGLKFEKRNLEKLGIIKVGENG